IQFFLAGNREQLRSEFDFFRFTERACQRQFELAIIGNQTRWIEGGPKTLFDRFVLRRWIPAKSITVGIKTMGSDLSMVHSHSYIQLPGLAHIADVATGRTIAKNEEIYSPLLRRIVPLRQGITSFAVP